MQTFNLQSQKSQIDFPLILTTAFLVIFGLIMIYDASVVAAFRDFGDRLYYFKNQLVWASVGTIALFCTSMIDYHKLIRYSPIIFISSLFFLVIVLVPHIGTKVYGASRWINIGKLTFQPSEFAKLALIFYQTAILAKFQNYRMRLTDVIQVLFLPTLVITALVLLEPDLGTALILIGVTTTVYFIGNGPLIHFAFTLPALIIAAIVAVFTEPYRISRLKTFLDPTFDPQGASYQINQILIALKNGGLLGVGIGASRQKFDFIPEVHSDAIFSVVAEELGFLGSVFLICLFLYLATKAINIARGARDFEGKVLASAILALIAIQSLLNIASNVALIPLTGIPLPFISYGGSSLVVTMLSIGILINIKKQS